MLVAVGLPLVDFRLAAVALDAAGWDFAAVDDSVLLAWVEGFLGDTLFGVGQVPVPRDDCEVDLYGPEAAAVSIDCVLRLEPGFRWLIDDNPPPSAELTDTEADALAIEVARRWLDAGASPLCLSQFLGTIPVEDMEQHLGALDPAEAERVASAGATMAEGIGRLGFGSESRLVEADGVIP